MATHKQIKKCLITALSNEDYLKIIDFKNMCICNINYINLVFDSLADSNHM